MKGKIKSEILSVFSIGSVNQKTPLEESYKGSKA